MARTVCSTTVVILLSVLVGCQSADSGRSQRMPSGSGRLPAAASVMKVSDVREADIVEQVTVSREEYRQALDLLVGYYTKTGNNMKLQWAKKELKAWDTMPKYRYFPEGGAAAAELEPSALVPEADELFYDAVELEKRAERLGPVSLLKNEDLLRQALDKYNQLLRDHPSSDKIDDAAYKAAEICEYFKDYSIALVHYQKVYQWDPHTAYPARFKAARILDKHLHRNAEALELYRQAVETEGRYDRHRWWKDYAEERIRVLEKTDEGQDQR